MCETYVNDLKRQSNLGATILESAINLSLEYLDAKLKNATDISSQYSMYEVYCSLCVFEKQEWIRVPILAWMWDVDVTSAERIAMLFLSMSLGRGSVEWLSTALEQAGLSFSRVKQVYNLRH